MCVCARVPIYLSRVFGDCACHGGGRVGDICGGGRTEREGVGWPGRFGPNRLSTTADKPLPAP